MPEGLASRARHFADVTIRQKDVTSEPDQRQLQKDLDGLAIWKERWKMSFHSQKCSTLQMTRCGKTVTGSHSLHGHQIQNVTSHKYLEIFASVPHDLN